MTDVKMKVRSRDANNKLVDPTGAAFTAFGVVYPTMRHACIGRIYQTALANVPRLNKRSSSGWADLARATGIEQPKLTRAGKPRSHLSISSGVSNRIYGMAMRGTLPKDPEQLRKLLELAGSPWKEEFGNELLSDNDKTGHSK